MSLTLEVNETFDQPTGDFGSFAITPAISPDYWIYRVRLTDQQAILGFPKFDTVGIGFEHEKDWNSNLPFSCPAEKIYDHIKHNKGDARIKRQRCLDAINIVREAARLYKGLDDAMWASEQERMR